jgi:hypothetical protein
MLATQHTFIGLTKKKTIPLPEKLLHLPRSESEMTEEACLTASISF